MRQLLSLSATAAILKKLTPSRANVLSPAHWVYKLLDEEQFLQLVSPILLFLFSSNLTINPLLFKMVRTHALTLSLLAASTAATCWPTTHGRRLIASHRSSSLTDGAPNAGRKKHDLTSTAASPQSISASAQDNKPEIQQLSARNRRRKKKHGKKNKGGGGAPDETMSAPPPMDSGGMADAPPMAARDLDSIQDISPRRKRKGKGEGKARGVVPQAFAREIDSDVLEERGNPRNYHPAPLPNRPTGLAKHPQPYKGGLSVKSTTEDPKKQPTGHSIRVPGHPNPIRFSPTPSVRPPDGRGGQGIPPDGRGLGSAPQFGLIPRSVGIKKMLGIGGGGRGRKIRQPSSASLARMHANMQAQAPSQASAQVTDELAASAWKRDLEIEEREIGYELEELD